MNRRRKPDATVSISLMTTLLNSGYPLSDELRLAIARLVSAAAMLTRPDGLLIVWTPGVPGAVLV